MKKNNRIIVLGDEDFLTAHSRENCFLYLPQSEYITGTVESAGMSEEDIVDFISYHANRYLPEPKENICFELLPCKSRYAKVRRALFTRKTDLRGIRDTYPSACLICLLSGFVEPAEDFIRIVWGDNWVEWAEKSAGLWGEPQHAPLPDGLNVNAFMKDIAPQSTNIQHIYVQTNPIGIEKAIAMDPSRSENTVLKINEALLPHFSGLFPPNNRRRQNILRFASCALLALGFILFNAGILSRRLSYDKQTIVYNHYQDLANKLRKEQANLDMEISKAKSGVVLKESNAVSNPYQLLYSITKIKPLGLVIDTFTFSHGHFRLSGLAVSALDLCSRLSKVQGFSDLVLTTIQPQPSGKEHFILSGEFK